MSISGPMLCWDPDFSSSSGGHKVRVMMIFFWLEKFDDKNEVPWPTFSNLFFPTTLKEERVRPLEEDLRQQQKQQ